MAIRNSATACSHSLSASSWVLPPAFSALFATTSEWSASSTTQSAEGARMRWRTLFEKVERAERIARPLNEHDWRPQREQDFVAQLRPVAGGAQRIAEADHGCDRLREGDMAADPSAHALAGERDRPVMFVAERGERRPVGRDELFKRIRPSPAFEHVRVVERLDRAERIEKALKSLHARVRRRRSRSRRKKKRGFGHCGRGYPLSEPRRNRRKAAFSVGAGPNPWFTNPVQSSMR